MLSCLTREFEEAGVSCDRVVILPHLNPEQIVELLKHVTVYLDTFPYSGAASYMEPLAALCPAVTLRGETQRGLQGAAMMEAMGLGELIAETYEHYVELAVSVALDQERRKRMVRRMMAMKPSVAFLDVNSFGERVGRGLEAMVAEIRSNRHPTKIEEARVR
jgi:predicted O-linked N-acetylglucosamine transferase (SPINDLY family)